jgi:hypothetical protein
MRVYVASSFSRKPDVRRVMDLLRAAGHEISYDWTPEDASGLTAAGLEEMLRGAATRELEGVLSADAAVVLHDERGRGMATEFGVAVAARKFVVVVGARADPTEWGEMRNVFYYLPTVVHADDEAQAVSLISAFECSTDNFFGYGRRNQKVA